MMKRMFEIVEEADDEYVHVVKVSFLEIYNEKIHDLLDSRELGGTGLESWCAGQKTNLQIKEDRLRGIFVQGLTEVVVQTPQEMKAVMQTGSTNRTIAATRMNERSSRSHSLFQVGVSVKNLRTDWSQVSKLCFVDLAGSEKIAKTQVSGQQLEEAKNINKSLTCLGMVVG